VAEREAVDRIQQIGLAHAVLTHKTVQLGRELQVGLNNVAVILHKQMFQLHFGSFDTFDEREITFLFQNIGSFFSQIVYSK
jgi:5,10-methenyltetrahydromethanopterin hydrogenase